MKKIVSILLVLVTVLSMGTMAFADGTTTLTTTVPAATYTLNIPADQTIAFGATETDIGNITVTESVGFAVGKNLKVTATWEGFISETVATTIPFTITSINTHSTDTYKSGDSFIFEGMSNGSTYEQSRDKDMHDLIYSLILTIKSTDWGKALGGDYTATITFTSEVVVAD